MVERIMARLARYGVLAAVCAVLLVAALVLLSGCKSCVYNPSTHATTCQG